MKRVAVLRPPVLVSILVSCACILVSCSGLPSQNSTGTSFNSGNFSISVTPVSISTSAGSSDAAFTVSTSTVNQFEGSVTVAVSGLPAGTTIAPASPFKLAAGSSQNVSFTVPASASQGNYTIKVDGSSGSLAHSASLALTVDPVPDFSLNLSTTTLTTDVGSSPVNFNASVKALSGFNNPVSLAISGLPAGATTSPASPFTISPGSTQSVSISLPASVVPGSYTIQIRATSGSLAHVASLTLIVNPISGYTIAVSPTTITGSPGSTSTFNASITAVNSFTSPVSVALSGLPSGATTSPASPFTVSPGNSQDVSISIPTSVAAGNYTIVATGTSGHMSHSASLTLTVTSNPDFNIAVSPPSLTMNAGSAPSTFSTSITAVNGFSGLVSVAISGLPSGASTSPASPFTVGAGSSQTVSLTVPSTVAPGSYTLTITGSSGSLVHSATLALTVSSPSDFTIAVSPSSLTGTAGSSNSSFTTSISALNGFSNAVSVAISGLPSGTTTSPASPFTVFPGNSQSVTLTLPTTAATGSYTVTVTGTSSSLTHSATLDLTVVGQASITTWHYDNGRTGADINETILTPENVNSNTFGKIANYPVDGLVTGHPLYLENVNIAGQGVHNVVFAATMHDSVFAFDADSASTTPLWMTSILNYSPAGATTVPASVTRDSGPTGWTELGIISTPVIDPAAGIMYLVAETYENGLVVHRLHALDITTGLEALGGPTTISATYTLNGETTTFSDTFELNRPALVLANGHIYVGFGSNCCNAYSQGWVLSYNATTLQQEGTFTAEPGNTLASIWQKGAGISADSNGYVYTETGEGPYTAGTNLSTSVIKLSQNGTTLGLADWFTPYNHSTLSSNDEDLANAVVILPDQPGPYPHEAVTLGKVGPIFVLNRDNMGQLCSTCTASDTQIVQEVSIPGVGYMSPVYWNNTVYINGAGVPVTAYSVSNGALVLPAAAQSATFVGTSHAIITANGNTNGILWLIGSGQWVIALDAITLNTLYNSENVTNGRDTLPAVPHFASPIAADGKIFIGTQTSIVVYGLLSGSPGAQSNLSLRAPAQNMNNEPTQ